MLLSDNAPILSPQGTDYRDALVDYLRRQLIGPIDGVGEVLSDPPRVRYLLGLLFPQKSIRNATLLEEDDDSDLVTGSEEADNAPIVATDDWLPSSLGISFFTTADSVACEVWAARYVEVPSGRSRRWNREELAGRENPHKIVLTKDAPFSQLFGDRAKLTSLWRKFANGYLVTVALTNSVILEVDESGELTLEQKKLQDANCLHQVGFCCTPVDARLLQYPSVDDQFRDQEEEELRLTFSHASVYGVGHGCSVAWDVDERSDDRVWTEHMPVHDISPIIYDLDGFDDILELSNLVTYSDSNVVSRLSDFVDDYVAWHKRLLDHQVPKRFSTAKARILDRILEAATRMRNGIRYLEAHADAREAFRLANRAMLMQMFRNKRVIQDKSYARNTVEEVVFDLGECRYKWRPFQLAFQLLTLESASDSTHPDRDIVDLIWFPTGGGKTEAYLGLAAYVIFLRRLRHGDKGAGTAVITRYTLSLLTAQQFQRAATLICACELIRQESTSLGNKPFRIGLWIGEKNVPNRFSKARELFDIMIEEDEPRNPFQLQQCPWCGTLVIPSRKSPDSDTV